MKNAALFLFLATAFSAYGCAGRHASDGDAAPGDEQDITSACLKVGNQCLPNGMNKVPKSDAKSSFEGKCFKWNLVDVNSDEKVEQVAIDKVLKKDSESRAKNPDALTQMQLRLTEKFFDVMEDNDGKAMDPMKAPFDKVFEAGDDPIFTHWELKSNGAKYTQIDIALGDNPMDVVFQEGTLQPVVIVEDDNVAFCADEVKIK
jgi:hypothetical protein